MFAIQNLEQSQITNNRIKSKINPKNQRILKGNWITPEALFKTKSEEVWALSTIAVNLLSLFEKGSIVVSESNFILFPIFNNIFFTNLFIVEPNNGICPEIASVKLGIKTITITPLKISPAPSFLMFSY